MRPSDPGQERCTRGSLAPGTIHYPLALWLAACTLFAALMIACGSDHHPARPIPDTTPPGAITDLTAALDSVTSIRLVWTAPGDDGSSGRAACYDIRQALRPINAANLEVVGGTPRACNYP